MKKIFSLASFYVRSLLKQKATNIFVILALAIIALAFALSDINIGSRYKLFEDLLLGSQMLFLHIAALFYMFDFLQKERSMGLFILPLSTGLKRSSYLLAQFLVLALLIALLFIIFMSIDALMLYIFEGVLRLAFLWQLFLYALSAMLLGFLVILFSQFVSIMNAMIYSVLFFFVGSGLDELFWYSEHFSSFSQTQKLIVELLYHGLLNFSLFDIQSKVVNGFELDRVRDIIYPFVYALCIAVVLYLISLWKFKNRVLKIGE